ncbi:aldehyde dehydrogenase family protein [Actinomadura sp. NAK00032]|uniref:aldehyde dehydrogenase family protein n=1 Tax=Actinomadura sp. NAK00032 TaxID=2742128 RepID=UPI0015908DD4|nr:aldehyde dehydrogenase family protein [Actinomadura sp. NAK00032]QKW33267.1 aldehyde dehydrogenase family protein [Actinomadura sp. NAK00032]
MADLRAVFDDQRRAFRTPTLDERREHLGRLAAMVVRARPRIEQAMAADFTVHPAQLTAMTEVFGVAGQAAYAAEQLPAWTAPQQRFADPAFAGTATAAIEYQPKGVLGIMAPWNFPFLLSLGPLADMLAAGNRVIIKPSEVAPACAELLRELVADTFAPDHVAVVCGGVDLAKEFATLPWDHLLYTGNSAVGREVAMAAARNLTPLTLELGGKNPAIVPTVDAESVAQIIGNKAVKSGQVCIAPDYCLVPATQAADFIDLARAHVAAGYTASPDCTGIITGRHLDRLLAMLDEARDHGHRVITLEPGAETDRATRRIPLTLVIDPDDELQIMREEIFGPILPVKTYRTLDEAIAYVNAGDRPLGLYVFTPDAAVARHVLDRTISGGACVNTCAVQGVLPSLGFGGTGMSGYGRHRGIEGFREFSNQRGVFTRGQADTINTFFPPYT